MPHFAAGPSEPCSRRIERREYCRRCTPDDGLSAWLLRCGRLAVPLLAWSAPRVLRKVEKAWPQVGSRLHHSFGAWPALLNDVTVVEVYEPPRRMVVRAKGWPIGEARVTIDVKPRGRASVVRIQEEAVAGPGRLIPDALLDLVLYWRNTETLQRLAYLAEGMAGSLEPTTAGREIRDGDASS